jgi:hypothetical protein
MTTSLRNVVGEGVDIVIAPADILEIVMLVAIATPFDPNERDPANSWATLHEARLELKLGPLKRLSQKAGREVVLVLLVMSIRGRPSSGMLVGLCALGLRTEARRK